MTTYNDNEGNYFWGDCQWGNHDPAYPNNFYFKSFHSIDTLNDDLTDLTTLAGLQVDVIASQAQFDTHFAVPNFSSPLCFINFSGVGDIVNTRYAFVNNYPNINGEVGGYNVFMYNNLGSDITSLTNQTQPQTNAIVLGNNWDDTSDTIKGIDWNDTTNATNVFTPIQTVGVANERGLTLFLYQFYHKYGATEVPAYKAQIFHGGQFGGVNPNYGIYTPDFRTRSLVFTNNLQLINGSPRSTSATANALDNGDFYNIKGYHYVQEEAQEFLRNGDAEFTIVCADAQNPIGQWGVPSYYFHDDATLGNPAVGRVDNFILAEGTGFNAGQVTQITGGVFPSVDPGLNNWLPIAMYAGKVLMLRCYSAP